MTTTKYADQKKLLQERMKNLRDEMADLGSDYLKDACKGLFSTYPELVSFSWEQYTPYFNDGDVCEFSVYADYPKITHTNEDGELVEEDEEIYVPYKVTKGEEEPTRLHSMSMNISDMLESMDESLMKDLFGDHVSVTVDREGIEVREYNHD